MIERSATGAALAISIALAAWRIRLLTAGGAAVATLIGTLAVAAGWQWGILLILFFVASSTLSAAAGKRHAPAVRDIVDKRGARDAVQVLANGSVFAAAAAGSVLWPHDVWSAAGLGALAAATADTWGTEIGSMARGEPRLFTTWRSVPTGTSGAVSPAGLAATACGAAFIAGAAMSLGWGSTLAAAALAGGLAGAASDSLLGATVQQRRRCETCAMETEQRIHRCGTQTHVIGGLAWLENDAVNLFCTFVGAAVAAALSLRPA
ncbi:MAG TPA: DUF92 domain-containing protein [Gemmatimonadaceae bacterium]|nr:DUF92 domain-containing protein [Gemmatimonadaceae bacterium]